MRAVALLLFLVSCGQPVPPQAPSTAPPQAPSTAPPEESSPASPSPSASANRPPVPPQERNIYVDTIEIANPVVVTGRARTFENNVALRLRDSSGKLIVEDFTTSAGEMGHHNPFRAALWVTRDPGPSITVEALEYSARDGSETSRVAVTRPFAVEPVSATLYLPNADCTGVAAHVRRIPKSISMARLLVEVLMVDPATPFPKGSRVQSVNLRDGVLTVDFNERLQNVGGACAAQMIRESVTRTLSALPSVRKVVITAAGSERLALQP